VEKFSWELTNDYKVSVYHPKIIRYQVLEIITMLVIALSRMRLSAFRRYVAIRKYSLIDSSGSVLVN